MTDFKKCVDALAKLDTKNMYNNDFFLTWEKTDDELRAVWAVADALRALRERNISTKVFDSGLGISLFGTERIGAEVTLAERRARPLTDKWTFSTNGVSIMGRNGIPCIGFGPGAEAQAHAPNEITWKQDLVTCAAVYAILPTNYCK